MSISFAVNDLKNGKQLINLNNVDCMAKFLNTTGVSYHLENIIKNANDRLVLISPFLKINNRIRELLEDKNRLKIDTRLIYGKSELQPDETDWLNSMKFIRTSYCDNLHAKCYINEDEALITSMNLYEFSQQNNNEMGIIVNREKESELYHSIYEETKRLIRVSDEVQISVKKVKKYSNNKSNNKKNSNNSIKTGFCIRCKTKITLDPLHPYCTKCYTSWKKYKDSNYSEKYCHICGKEMKTSLNKPSCYSCFKKNRNKISFPKSKKLA
jgi:hypothetical protein